MQSEPNTGAPVRCDALAETATHLGRSFLIGRPAFAEGPPPSRSLEERT
jgi:hypothetical protein